MSFFDLYDNLLLTGGIALVCLFIYGLYRVLRPIKARKKAAKGPAVKPVMPKLVVTSSDISAIAGDDVMATQLDLARAYIETGRHLLAKKILDHVCSHGNVYQQEEALQLLKSI